MTREKEEFEAHLERIREGSPEAVREFLDRYGNAILAVIRRRLDEEVRSVFDSIDFLQDVWASFFGSPEQLNFSSPKALFTYLVRMARNKVTDVMRRRLWRPESDLVRERSLDGSARLEALHLSVPDPTPAEAAMSKERWDLVLEGRPFHHQQILELLRQGYTHREIGERLGLHEKVVQRLLRSLAARAQQ
jgi:RNA polymerase sigma-70 factor (ECF subfamily)